MKNNSVPNGVRNSASSVVPIIEPINIRQYEFKQSKHEMADKLPFAQKRHAWGERVGRACI